MKRFQKVALAAMTAAFALAMMPVSAHAEWYGDPLARVYNPVSGEHLYTTHEEEVEHLQGEGWIWERDQTVGVYSTQTMSLASGSNLADYTAPVWRLYKPSTGDHHYTTDAYECQVLTSEQGWEYDFNGQPAFYSTAPEDFELPADGTDEDIESTLAPFYRIYNTRAARFGHLFTADANERRVHLSEGGWDDEGIAWYAYPVPNPSTFGWDFYS